MTICEGIPSFRSKFRGQTKFRKQKFRGLSVVDIPLESRTLPLSFAKCQSRLVTNYQVTSSGDSVGDCWSLSIRDGAVDYLKPAALIEHMSHCCW